MKSRTPLQDLDRAIDGVALADATEVHAHAFAAEHRGAGGVVDKDVAVIHERQPLLDLLAIGNRLVFVLVVEFPEAGECGKRDVEGSVRLLADLPRDVQHVARLRRDRHGGSSRCGVQSNDVAAVLPNAHHRVEPIEFAEDGCGRCGGAHVVAGPDRHAQLRAHRLMRVLDQMRR